MKNMLSRENFSKYMCVVVLAALFLLFAITTEGWIVGAANLRNILNQSITTIIGGLGMIFVVAVGGTDISIGSLVVFTATLAFIIGDYVANPYGNLFVMFVICIVVGLLNGLLIGVLNTRCKVASFMLSLSLNIALRGAASWILGANVYLISDEMRTMDSWPVKIPVLIVLVAVIWYVFEYTRFGYYCKAIGENENAIKYAGVKVNTIKTIAFVISGIMAGVAAMFTVARIGGTNNTMAQGYEMRVMMALFVAGIPVTGGSSTRIYKLLVGAITINVLESGLTLMGVSGATVQLVRGLVLLGLVFASSLVANGAERYGFRPEKKKQASAALGK